MMNNENYDKNNASNYDPKTIEPKWQEFWDKNKTFAASNDFTKPKYYILDMFPYPSGAGLHVGHVLGYTATDILSRYKKANGFNVLHPMGWDAFGLPAEQYAILTGTHPKITTEKNIAVFRNQLKQLGYSYDWDREVNTSQPDYYRWTQFLFRKLYEKGLAYMADVPVNWCPELGTVLANEEVIDGKSERGGFPVIRKPMRQWILKITEYAERLLEDLDLLDWPDYLKDMQRNWIGKSIGAQLKFKVDDHEVEIEVFTTRPDTLFGASYLVLAPEHHLVDSITTENQRAAVSRYQEEAARKSDRKRTDEKETKTGIFTGAYAINPVNGKRIPIWIADYVLSTYGTGAIMAVPAHDDRDWSFAKTYNLEIVEVVKSNTDLSKGAFVGYGFAMNSGFLDGLETPDAKKKMIAWLESEKIGFQTVNYKLRDWIFARQRYWGEPFPIVHTEDGPQLIDESELPLELPKMTDFLPTKDGQPPLARATEWVATTYHGKPAERETNTMPQWAGSCWYYLRYIDPHNTAAPWSAENEKYWMNVDLYVGGTEHAVLHLLYARFWHKVFYDCGLVTTKEPFQKLVNQGMILGKSYKYQFKEGNAVKEVMIPASDVRWMKDGEKQVPMHPTEDIVLDEVEEKMSKSKGNVVNPSDVIEQYGADALRLYEIFMGPLDQLKPWNTDGVGGTYRFLARIWRLICDPSSLAKVIVDEDATGDLNRELHETIKKVTEDIEELRFNTAIAKLMEFTNTLYKLDKLPKSALSTLVVLLAPFAPHISEELWQRLGGSESVAISPWPVYDENALISNSYELPVQVMGKLRGTIDVPNDCDEATAVGLAMATVDFLKGKTVRKVIFRPGRIINFVIE